MFEVTYAEKSEKTRTVHIYDWNKEKTLCGYNSVYSKFRLLSGRPICKKCIKKWEKMKGKIECIIGNKYQK